MGSETNGQYESTERMSELRMVVTRKGVVPLAGSQLSFEFGSVVWWLLLPIIAANVSDASATQISVIVTLSTVANLVASLPFGVIADRASARSTMITCSAAKVGIALVVLGGVIAGYLPVWVLFIMAFLGGMAECLYYIGQQAVIPKVLSDDDLVGGNSILRGSESVAQVSGSLIGGWLMTALGVIAGPIVDIVSNVAAIAMAGGLPAERNHPKDTGSTDPEPQPGQLRTELLTGLRIVRDTPVFRTLLGCGVTLNIASSMSVAVESAFAVVTLGATPLQLGFLFAIGSVGGILAGVLATPLVKKLGLWRSLRLGLVVFCPWAFLLPLAQSGWWVLLIGIGNAAVTFGLMIVVIASATIRQRSVDADAQGRVASTFRWITGGVVPIGSIIGTVLNGFIGTRPTLVVSAILLCCGVLWVLRNQYPSAATSVPTLPHN